MINFKRIIKVEYADQIKTYPELEMTFSAEFDTTSNGNKATLTIFNLAKSSLNSLVKDTEIKIYAGYEGNIGLIFSGVINQVETSIEGLDKKTIINIIDSTNILTKTIINQTWTRQVKASYIINEIIEKTGIAIGYIRIADDIRYDNGKTFSTDSKKALELLAKDTNSKFHINKRLIYFSPANETNRVKVTINSYNGLLSSPQLVNKENQERYLVKTLLKHEIDSDALLEITSKTINGLYRVIKGVHTENFETECEVIEL